MLKLFTALLLISSNSAKYYLVETEGSFDSPHTKDDGHDYSDYSKNSMENNTCGSGSLKTWLDTVDCLEEWEKNLRLGDVCLNTTAESECAQARFTLGLISLHNFQYDLAKELFENAYATEQSETGRSFPMAMWGAAMATTKILWQESDCEKGKKYLGKISTEAKWITEKEKALIETGFALYPRSLTCAKDNDQNTRETRYMKAMTTLTKKYPEETEALVFWAVSAAAVLGHPRCKQDRCQTLKKSVLKTLKSLEQKHPTHSGVIHCTVHLFDQPELYTEANKIFLHKMIPPIEQKDHAASIGIRAAHKYPTVAISSCHALHMPSHIYLRLGNWSKSLESNLQSIKACDRLSERRGKTEESLYDFGNLYHGIEYAQNDYFQRGQYSEARKMISRVESIISKLGGPDAWKKNKKLIWIHQGMHTRQLIESFQEGTPLVENSLNRSLVPDPIDDGTMNNAAISELGRLLEFVVTETKICSKDKKNSCESNNYLINRALEESKKLQENLKPRKSTQEYIKHTARMFHQVMLGIQDLAERLRPHGLKCFLQKNCKASGEKLSDSIINDIVTGPLRKATEIQTKDMIQSSVTPTLLYIPSWEVYGHVLLVIKKYQKAKEMFEAGLERRMGRTLSLLGLARAHAMLGNTKEADYFYEYLQFQLEQSDEGNPVVREAERWLKSKKALREDWFLPNYLP